MSTIQVIGIDQDRYSNLQNNSHIQTQSRGGTKFFGRVKNHLQLKQGATSSNIHKSSIKAQYIAQKPKYIDKTIVTKCGRHPTTNKSYLSSNARNKISEKSIKEEREDIKRNYVYAVAPSV